MIYLKTGLVELEIEGRNIIISFNVLLLLVSQGDITYLQIVDSMMVVVLVSFDGEWGRVRNLRFLTTLVPRRHMTTTCLIPDTGNFSFMVAIYIQITQSSCDGSITHYVAIFCRILPYSASHNILPNSASRNILPNSASHTSALVAFTISFTPS